MSRKTLRRVLAGLAFITVIGMLISAGFIISESLKTDKTIKFRLDRSKVDPYGHAHVFCTDNTTIFVKYDRISQNKYNCSNYQCKYQNSMGCGSLDKYAVNCVVITTFNMTSHVYLETQFNDCFKKYDINQLGEYREYSATVPILIPILCGCVILFLLLLSAIYVATDNVYKRLQ